MTERPTFSECVIGYRSWKLDDWVLTPVSFGSPWRPGVNRAVCKAHETASVWYLDPSEQPKPKTHPAPQQNCTCGLHAYHEIPEQPDGTGAQIIVGAVAAWGNLQVHCNGFRAEYAQIVALVADAGLDEIAELYGVPLVAREMLAAEAQQHGSPLPTSMRPKFQKDDALEQAMTRMAARLWQQPIYWSGPSYQQVQPAPTYTTQPAIWTPEEDKGKSPDDKLAKYRKPPANRQGPVKPKRGPKKLGPGR